MRFGSSPSTARCSPARLPPQRSAPARGRADVAARAAGCAVRGLWRCRPDLRGPSRAVRLERAHLQLRAYVVPAHGVHVRVPARRVLVLPLELVRRLLGTAMAVSAAHARETGAIGAFGWRRRCHGAGDGRGGQARRRAGGAHVMLTLVLPHMQPLLLKFMLTTAPPSGRALCAAPIPLQYVYRISKVTQATRAAPTASWLVSNDRTPRSPLY